MTETLIPLYQLGSLPRLVFALFFAGSPQSLSEYPTLLFLLDHVLLISFLFIFRYAVANSVQVFSNRFLDINKALVL